MSETPTQREPPPKLDRAPTAHERRARLIAQLHEQAMATARKPIKASVAKDARRRKAVAWTSIARLYCSAGLNTRPFGNDGIGGCHQQIKDAAVRRMFKAMTFIAALVLFCAIAYGLWDLFRGASLLVGVVALIFVAAGAFNTWAAFNINTGERNHDAS